MPAYPDSVDNAYEYWHRHVKLITALTTAVEKGEETLDKEATSILSVGYMLRQKTGLLRLMEIGTSLFSA
ncbi:MAG: hypothetical protein WBV84_04485 [Nitrososphaeraceae archaeon]|jgi:hypothetical protein